MTYAEICKAARKLKREHKTTDPVAVCAAKGIKIIYQNFGAASNAIKGFYLEYNRIKTITINADLPLTFQRIILAHELGHSMLHRRSGLRAFHDVTMFDESSVMEKEANLFAAEFLMEDNDVLEVLNQDMTFFNAASILRVPVELLDFKFRVMKWKGYMLIEPPISSSNNFLRDMEVPESADYAD